MRQAHESAIKEIFEEAADLAPEARPTFLDRACASDAEVRQEVERLLRAHDQAEGLFEPVKPLVVHTPPVVVQEKPGDTIGPYKLLQQIGEGGFGAVYMAEQSAPVRRRVALKILKLGMDTKQVIARFEAERQALAMMDHPHIAKVFDAGATATGRPYFVMELVKGIPITTYCDEARLPTRERLELFKSVCQALQHAHQKGIIHRDIKPTNVLVTLHDGVPVPKVIDFGIAKATEARLTERTLFTEFHQIVGTPEYMSPEQAEMSGLDVDTRADIYSLGVLLYELLTGTKPLDLDLLLAKGYGEMLKTIREVDPPRPSTRVSSLGGKARAVAHRRNTAADLLPKALAGDLDWIVMRAIEKDRTHRYATAAALASDIERHLEDRPVEARPPSLAYTLRKFVRRNQTAVVAGAVAAAAIAVGLVLAVLGGVEAANQRDVARAAERTALADRNAAERATEQERTAREREAEARAAAIREAERALAERDAKEIARRDLAAALVRSEGARLVSTSNAWLSRDPTVALLLAIEGARRDPGLLGNTALLQALGQVPASERIFELGPTAGWAPIGIDRAGRRLGVANAEHDVRLYDVETGRLLHTLTGHQNLVRNVEISGDGRTVLTSSEDWTAGVWNAGTGELAHALRGHRGLVDAYWGPTGTVLTTSWDGTARLWDAKSGEVVHDLGSMPVHMMNGRFLGQGDRVLLWCPAELRVHDASSGARLGAFGASAGSPFVGLTNSVDGRWLVVTSRDRTLWLLDGVTAEVVATAELPGSEYVSGIGVLPDATEVVVKIGERLLRWRIEEEDERARLERIGGSEGTPFPYVLAGGHLRGDRLVVPDVEGGIAAMRLPSFELAWTLRLHDGNVRRCFFHPDGRRVFTLGQDGTVRLVDPHRPGAARILEGEPPRIAQLDVSPDGRWVAASSAMSQVVSLWRSATGERVHRLEAHCVGHDVMRSGCWPRDVEFGPKGRDVLTCGMEGKAIVWSTTSGRERTRLEPAGGIIWEGAFSPDGRQVVLGSQDEVARIYDARTGDLLQALGEPHVTGATGTLLIGARMVGYDPSGTLVYAVAMSDALVRVFSAATGTQRAVFDGFLACFSPEGDTLAVSLPQDFSLGRTETSTALVDVESMTVRHRVPGLLSFHPRPFTPDGRAVLTFRSGRAVLFDVRTGAVLRELDLDRDMHRLGGLGASPDGRFATGVDGRGRLLLWDLASGRQRLRRDGCAVEVAPRFAPDGSWVAVAKTDGTVEIVPTDPLATAEREKPRDFTEAERERFRIRPLSSEPK